MIIKRKKYEKLIKELADKEERIRILEHNCLILLENSKNDRVEKKNLENNLEFVTNNLTPKKKKLIGRD